MTNLELSFCRSLTKAQQLINMNIIKYELSNNCSYPNQNLA